MEYEVAKNYGRGLVVVERKGDVVMVRALGRSSPHRAPRYLARNARTHDDAHDVLNPLDKSTKEHLNHTAEPNTLRRGTRYLFDVVGICKRTQQRGTGRSLGET